MTVPRRRITWGCTSRCTSIHTPRLNTRFAASAKPCAHLVSVRAASARVYLQSRLQLPVFMSIFNRSRVQTQTVSALVPESAGRSSHLTSPNRLALVQKGSSVFPCIIGLQIGHHDLCGVAIGFRQRHFGLAIESFLAKRQR